MSATPEPPTARHSDEAVAAYPDYRGMDAVSRERFASLRTSFDRGRESAQPLEDLPTPYCTRERPHETIEATPRDGHTHFIQTIFDRPVEFPAALIALRPSGKRAKR